MSNFSHVFMWQMYPESELCFKKWKDIFYNDEIKQLAKLPFENLKT